MAPIAHDLSEFSWLKTVFWVASVENRRQKNKKFPSDDNQKLAKIYSMQIYYTEENQNTYPCRPEAGLRSRTNVVDGDDEADLRVV